MIRRLLATTSLRFLSISLMTAAGLVGLVGCGTSNDTDSGAGTDIPEAPSNGTCTSNGVGCTCKNGTTNGSTCARAGSDYDYREVLTSTTRSITISGCPNHANVDYTPNSVTKGSLTIVVPLLPGFIDVTEANGTSLVAQANRIGILFDGSTMYSAYGGATYGSLAADLSNSYANSAPKAEGYSFDMCGQHSSGSNVGAYHTHVPPACLLNQLGATATTISPRLGYAVDGFPVYGPRGPNGVYMKRCSEATADKTYCLDKCGGFYDATQKFWKDGYVYRYFILGPYNGTGSTEKCANDLWRDKSVGKFDTCSYSFNSTFFPFTPLCLRGCVPTGTTVSNSALTAAVPACSTKTNVIQGYTSAAAVPKAMNALAVYSPPTSCVTSACTTVGSTGYPVPNACVHDAPTGALR